MQYLENFIKENDLNININLKENLIKIIEQRFKSFKEKALVN